MCRLDLGLHIHIGHQDTSFLLVTGEPTAGVNLFETGIKVIDLLKPYKKDVKIGLFGGAGVGKTIINQVSKMEFFHIYWYRLKKPLDLLSKLCN